MTKKIILIGGIVIILAVAAFLIFSARQNSDTTTENVGFNIKDFFPFGNPDDPSNNIENTNEETPVNTNANEIEKPIPNLRKISNGPVAGAVMYDIGTTSVVRFTVKDTGNVYEAKSNSSNITRLTNTTIPKINRAVWLPNGEGFIAQKTDDSGTIETSFVKLRATKSTSTSELTLPYEPLISNLPTDIQEVTVSPDSKKIFYYTAYSGMKGYISNPDGTATTLSYTNILTEWIPNWYSANSILLSMKSSFEFAPIGLSLNTVNKSTTRIYGGIEGGSSTIRNDGKYILVTQGGDIPFLNLITVQNENKKMLQIKTLADKCAWKGIGDPILICGVPKSFSKNKYPDAWYQGTAITDDYIVMIDVNKTLTYPITDPKEEANTAIDAENLSVSKNGSYVMFTNKIDQSLWMLKI